jgi:hypothetical protein
LVFHLWQWLVRTTGFVSCAVGEEEIDDHSDEREQEDDKDPEDLVAGWARRLQKLDYCTRNQRTV